MKCSALAQAGANLQLLENDRYDAVTIAAVADDEATLQLLLTMGASATPSPGGHDDMLRLVAAHLIAQMYGGQLRPWLQ